MKNAKENWMLTCDSAARLIEKRNHETLGYIESLKLFWHKKVCHLCDIYQKQSDLLNKHLRKNALNTALETDSSALEKRILEGLEKVQREN
jgi:hypothetical protein